MSKLQVIEEAVEIFLNQAHAGRRPARLVSWNCFCADVCMRVCVCVYVFVYVSAPEAINN